MWIFPEYLQRKSGGRILVVKDEWVFGSGEAQKDITACAVCVCPGPCALGTSSICRGGRKRETRSGLVHIPGARP